MAYAYDAGLIDRIMPRIKQYEATTGRKISQSMLDALMKGQLSAEVDKAQQTRAIDLQEEQFANQKEQQDKAAKAASIKGYVDTASTAGMGYLTYKAVTKPSAMSELIAYQKSLGAVPGTGVPAASVPAYSGGVPSVTSGVSGVEYGTGVGAQTTLAGGTTATGAQIIPEAGGFHGAGIGDFAVEAGAGEGLGSAGATPGASSYFLPAVAGVAAFGAAKPLLKKISKEVVGLGEGSKIDEALGGKAIAKADKDLGQVLNNILGDELSSFLDVSVICSELLRQGEITKRDRTACVVFRFRYIPDDMFMAYLEWAEPIVRLMRNNRAANFFLVPFAMHFVGYMLAVQAKVEPTITERLVWKYAWWRCEKIARLAGQSVKEVAA